MTFVHGDVRWGDGATVDGRDAMERMIAATGHYPWADAAIRSIRGAQSSHVVLGAQSLPGDPPPLASNADTPTHVVADLRLDGRSEFDRRYGSSGLPPAAAIARAYRRDGDGVAGRVIGDGVFVVWDAERQRVLCWRDAVGTRPLYYHHRPGRHLVLSSDLGALTAHPDVPALLDLAHVRARLEFGQRFFHLERTFCQGILSVRPGHVLVVDRQRARLQRYWDPEDAPQQHHRDEREYVDELREIVDEAVKCRLPAQPRGVAAHLSGGLDSSSMAVLAQRELQRAGDEVVAVSWAPSLATVPRLADRDERALVESVASSAGITPRYTDLDLDRLVELHRRDHALQPTAMLHAETSASAISVEAGASVVLSGWGGDEFIVFNGRGYLADLARRGRWIRLQRELRARAVVQGAKVRNGLKSMVVRPLLPDAAVDRLFARQSHAVYALPRALRPEFARMLMDVEPLDDARVWVKPGVRRMQRDLLEWGHLQRRTDSWASYGASVGLTYRFPLLDRRVVEFAFRVPDHLYFRDGWKRWLYRTAMDGILPDQVRWHPVKHDTALELQLTRALSSVRERLTEQLIERRDNAFVDVDLLTDPAAMERRSQDESTQGRRSNRPEPPPELARWLAFTAVRLT